MVAAPRDHEVGSCAALPSSWARLGTGKIMQVSHAFFRVLRVSVCPLCALSWCVILPSETSRSTQVLQSCLWLLPIAVRCSHGANYVVGLRSLHPGSIGPATSLRRVW